MAKIGDTLAHRYELIEELGRGASGAVFKATDSLLDTVVCIKVLIEGLAGDTEVVERFKRELLIARKVSHPGVCKSFDLQTEGEAVFLVMEFVDGENLNDRLDRERPLPLADAVRIIRGAAQALGAAHAAGVVHRDLKPANILIRPDGSVSVVDFGIAVAADMSKLTRPGLVLGSKKYVAPERWVGQEATPAVDVWSLGIILYGCLTGRLPYRGDGTFGVLDAIKTTTPEKPSVLRPELPKLLDDIVDKALAVNPEERYPHAGALDEALSIIDDGAANWTPTQVTPAPLPAIPELPDDPPTVGERPSSVGAPPNEDAPTLVGAPPPADTVGASEHAPGTAEGIPRDVTMESQSVPSQTAEADPAELTAEGVLGRDTLDEDADLAASLEPIASDDDDSEGEAKNKGPIPGAPGWEPATEPAVMEEPLDEETAAALEAAAFQFELMPNTAPGIEAMPEELAAAEAAIAEAASGDTLVGAPPTFDPEDPATFEQEELTHGTPDDPATDADLFAQVPDRSGGAKQSDVETELVRKPSMAEVSGPHAVVFQVPASGPAPGAKTPPYKLIAAASGAVGLLLLLLVLWPSDDSVPDDTGSTGHTTDTTGDGEGDLDDTGQQQDEDAAPRSAAADGGPQQAAAATDDADDDEPEPEAWDFVDDTGFEEPGDDPSDEPDDPEPEVADATAEPDQGTDPDPDVVTKPGQNQASKTRAADKRRYIALKKQVSRKMSSRGLVGGDDRTLDGYRRKMARAGRRGRYGEAAKVAKKAFDRASTVAIDKALVSKKLKRLNAKYDRLQDAAIRQQVTDALRAARKPYGAQDWQGANKALNRAFKALR